MSQENTAKLDEEASRLNASYLLAESKLSRINQLKNVWSPLK